MQIYIIFTVLTRLHFYEWKNLDFYFDEERFDEIENFRKKVLFIEEEWSLSEYFHAYTEIF